ncbi:MAG: hypothetical protein U0V02_11275 [Anaerolineales bacterium]
MKKTIKLVFHVLTFLTALMNGCAPINAPTPILLTSTPALIPPANTPIFTATLTSLPTITATPTIEPPVIMTEFLTDVKILSHNSFDNYNSIGILELKETSTWGEGLTYGDGIILMFKLQNANEVSGFSFDTGVWRTDSDRGFGIINTTHPRVELTQGKDVIDRSHLRGNLSLKTDTWYNILMAIGKNERFLAVVWDPTDETHRAIYNITLGEKWSDKRWSFDIVIWGDETISIDDFYRISFGEFQ